MEGVRRPFKACLPEPTGSFGVIATELSLARRHLELGREDVIGEQKPLRFLGTVLVYSYHV